MVVGSDCVHHRVGVKRIVSLLELHGCGVLMLQSLTWEGEVLVCEE